MISFVLRRIVRKQRCLKTCTSGRNVMLPMSYHKLTRLATRLSRRQSTFTERVDQNKRFRIIFIGPGFPREPVLRSRRRNIRSVLSNKKADKEECASYFVNNPTLGRDMGTVFASDVLNQIP